jgi:hypothetical protein
MDHMGSSSVLPHFTQQTENILVYFDNFCNSLIALSLSVGIHVSGRS